MGDDSTNGFPTNHKDEQCISMIYEENSMVQSHPVSNKAADLKRLLIDNYQLKLTLFFERLTFKNGD